MANYFDLVGGNRKKTIAELRKAVDNYMTWTVDGDAFKNEQDFEDAVRTMLEANGFIVQLKHNVENANKLVEERQFSSRIEDMIPDIAVECAEGLVFLELKFKNSDVMYMSDRIKIMDYVKAKKCFAAGVLFLDDKNHINWKQCIANKKYYYFWNL